MAVKHVVIRIETDAELAALKQTNNVVEVLGDNLKKTGATAKRTGKGVDKLGSEGRSGARGILELSRAFEDAQFGMRGVLNNIPGTIMAFGGGAGLAGAISIAAVTLDIFVRKFTAGNKKMQGDIKKTADEAQLFETALSDLEDRWEDIEEAAEEAKEKMKLAFEQAELIRETEDLSAQTDRSGRLFTGEITDFDAEREKLAAEAKSLVEKQNSEREKVLNEIAIQQGIEKQQTERVEKLNREDEAERQEIVDMLARRTELTKELESPSSLVQSGRAERARQKVIQNEIDEITRSLKDRQDRRNVNNRRREAARQTLEATVKERRRMQEEAATNGKLQRELVQEKLKEIKGKQLLVDQAEKQQGIDKTHDELEEANKLSADARKKQAQAEVKAAREAETALNARRSAGRGIAGQVARFGPRGKDEPGLPDTLRLAASGLQTDLGDRANTPEELNKLLPVLREAFEYTRNLPSSFEVKQLRQEIQKYLAQVKNGGSRR